MFRLILVDTDQMDNDPLLVSIHFGLRFNIRSLHCSWISRLDWKVVRGEIETISPTILLLSVIAE